jgi:hypothetical protein
MPLVGNVMAMDAKLPVVMAFGHVGWRPFEQDPLGIMSGRVVSSRIKGRESAIEKQLGFLDGPQIERVQRFWLPSGIAVELRRDPSAPLVAVSASITNLGRDSVFASPSERVRAPEKGAPDIGPAAIGESRYTITVPPRELPIGVDLAAGRLRLLLGEGSDDRLASHRRQVGAARRDALEKEPYGRAWLALGDALFPAGHPLEGTVLGAPDDPGIARDLLLAEALRQERSAARATIAVSGDVTREAVEEALSHTLGRMGRSVDVPVGPHPREERVLIEDAVPAPRLLYGWVAPAEGEPTEAAVRVAMEILTHPRVARLAKALATDATEVHGCLDLGPRGGVAALEIAPAPSRPAADVERRLDADLEALATAGPTWNELSLAKVLLKLQLEKELARIHGATPPPGGVRPVTGARLRNALRPGSLERLLQDLEQVSNASVRAAVRRTFGRGHRVVVTTWPRAVKPE